MQKGSRVVYSMHVCMAITYSKDKDQPGKVWRCSLSTCCCCKTAVLWPLACSIRKAFDQVNTSYFDFPKNKQ